MWMIRLRAVVAIVAFLFVPLVSRAQAQKAQGPRTTATLTISGMT